MRKCRAVHVESQVYIEGEPKTEPKARQTIDDEEVTSQRLRMNDVANTKTEVRYDGTTERVWNKLSSLLAKEQQPRIRHMT